MSKQPNTLNHISDYADTVLVDVNNTIWKDSGVSTLQDVLETFDIVSIQDKLATTDSYGMVILTKDSDLENLIGSDSVITSKQLIEFHSKPRATKDVYGTTKYAKTSEVTSGKSDDTSITPLELKVHLDNKLSKTDKHGLIKLSTESMVIPGIDNETAMTPKLVKFAINNLVPSVAIATENVSGTVTLANVNIAKAGTIREGYAISPYSFSNANATETSVGTVRLATGSEAKDPKIKDKVALSPSSLHKVVASTTEQGLIKIATTDEVKDKKDNTKAVTPLGLKYYYDLIEELRKKVTQMESAEYIPIGTILAFPNEKSGSKKTLPCDGGWYLKSEYPKLYAYLGSEYSVSSTHFRVPDYRGYFLRGFDKTGTVDPDGSARTFVDPQGDAIRNITGKLGGTGFIQVGGQRFSGAFTTDWSLKMPDSRSASWWDGMGAIFDASMVVPVAPENRPINKVVSYHIMAD